MEQRSGNKFALPSKSVPIGVRNKLSLFTLPSTLSDHRQVDHRLISLLLVFVREDAKMVSFVDGGSGILDLELFVDVADVGGYGRDADVETVGDLLFQQAFA